MADEARELFPITFGWGSKPTTRKTIEHLKGLPEPSVDDLKAVETDVVEAEAEMGKAQGTGSRAAKS